MKTIITYGTFDLFHYGHVELLKRLKALGDKLIVGVSTDEFNVLKDKKAFYTYEHRACIVGAVRYVDEVIPERNWEQKIDDVKRHNVDVFAIGNDWEGQFDFLKEHCEVVYMERTPNISSTQLRSSLNALNSVKKKDIEQMFEVLELLKQDLL